MTRRQALEDLFLSVKRYLINEGRCEQTAHIVATKMYNKVADNDEMTIKDIKRIRDIFIAQEVYNETSYICKYYERSDQNGP